MENNIYFGTIFHKRKFKNNYLEKAILYTDDEINYLDLDHIRWYDTNTSNRDYLIKDSLVPTKLEDYRKDYGYIIGKILADEKRMKEEKKRILLKRK